MESKYPNIYGIFDQILDSQISVLNSDDLIEYHLEEADSFSVAFPVDYTDDFMFQEFLNEVRRTVKVVNPYLSHILDLHEQGLWITWLRRILDGSIVATSSGYEKRFEQYYSFENSFLTIKPFRWHFHLDNVWIDDRSVTLADGILLREATILDSALLRAYRNRISTPSSVLEIEAIGSSRPSYTPLVKDLEEVLPILTNALTSIRLICVSRASVITASYFAPETFGVGYIDEMLLDPLFHYSSPRRMSMMGSGMQGLLPTHHRNILQDVYSSFLSSTLSGEHIRALHTFNAALSAPTDAIEVASLIRCLETLFAYPNRRTDFKSPRAQIDSLAYLMCKDKDKARIIIHEGYKKRNPEEHESLGSPVSGLREVVAEILIQSCLQNLSGLELTNNLKTLTM